MSEKNASQKNLTELSSAKKALLAKRLAGKNGVSLQKANLVISRNNKLNYLPPSFAQQRLWFLDQLEEGKTLYNVYSAYECTGLLNLDIFEKSLEEIIKRYDILRTNFRVVDDQLVQVIQHELKIEYMVIDLEELDNTIQSEEVQKILLTETNRRFDLEYDLLFRTLVIKKDARHNILLFTFHHIISDAWSIGVFNKNLTLIYNSLSNGATLLLPDLPIQYIDYSEWHRHLLESDLYNSQLAYWTTQLANVPSNIILPTDRPYSNIQTHKGEQVRFVIPEALSNELKKFSQQEGATLFMTLLAVFQTLLYRYSGQIDILVGTIINNRNLRQLEEQIGLFINTLVLRTNFAENPSFVNLLKQVREVTLNAFHNSEIPFEKVVEALKVERDLSHSPLFQVMLVFHNKENNVLNLNGLETVPLEVTPNTSRFDLTLDLMDTNQDILGNLEYNTALFDIGTIQDFIQHYLNLLEGILIYARRPISELPLLSSQERNVILRQWNTPNVDLGNETIIRRFEAQVIENFDSVALVFKDQHITYGMLNDKSNQLATYLVESGVKPETVVGLYLDRSIELMIGLLGILKSGGVYLPLDPNFPAQRIDFILTNAQVKYLICDKRKKLNLNLSQIQAIFPNDVPSNQELENVPYNILPENLAYMIFTSGSTGQPKGVMVTHQNLMNFFEGMDKLLSSSEEKTWLATTSNTFDISLLEFLWTICSGFKIVLQPDFEWKSTPNTNIKNDVAKQIDFSLSFFSVVDEKVDKDKYKLVIDSTKFADKNGFSAVWLPERHFHPFGGLYPNPSVIAAGLATITSNIKIRAGSVVLPLHNPIRVAEEWSVIDNLSKGRVALSFASGWHPTDFIFAPDIYKTRREFMRSQIETVLRLWHGETIDMLNSLGEIEKIKILPKPLQTDLPIWITSSGSIQTFKVAGELGANILTHLVGQSIDELKEKINVYRKTFRDNDPNSTDGHVTLLIHTFIGPNLDFVREKVQLPLINYLRNSLNLIGRGEKGTNFDNLSSEDVDALIYQAFERYFESNGFLGTPQKCLELIDRLRDIGVNEVACLIDFGVDASSVMESLNYLNMIRQAANKIEESDTDDYSLDKQIVQHGVSHLQGTPSLISMIMNNDEADSSLNKLKYLLIGGEKFSSKLLGSLKPFSNTQVFNMYGPTETTIWSSSYGLALKERQDWQEEEIPVGKPIINTQMYILDKNLGLLPAGVTGEIYIGGKGLARGYLNEPALTAEKFIPDPFSLEPGARLYHTGDLGRYLKNGNILCLGRDDQQVKIRGYRIELNEIEMVLRQHKAVIENVVLIYEDEYGDNYLVAYIKAKQPFPEIDDLKNIISAKLPIYMMPSTFIIMEEWPLTSNNKIDRKQLQAYKPQNSPVDVSKYFPRNDLEKEVARIFTLVLGYEQIGIFDNFFELGGHSLLATKVIALFRHTFNIDLPLRCMFETPNIAGLALTIEQYKNKGLNNTNTIIKRKEADNPQKLIDNIHNLTEEEVRIHLLNMLSEEEMSK